MKKFLFIVFVGLIFFPSIALAAWWQPNTWFNRWAFLRKKEAKTELLEQRVQELENKLQTVETSKETKKGIVPIAEIVTTTKETSIKATPPVVGKKIVTPSQEKINLEPTKKEIENQRIAKELAEKKVAELEMQQKLLTEAKNKEKELADKKAAEFQAQQQAIIDALSKAEALKVKQEAEAKQRAEAEANILREQIAQKQALLMQMQIECDNPINELKQKIFSIKNDYYTKVAEIQNQPISMASINGQITKLTNDTNIQIEQINNQISTLALQCSIKYRN